VRKNALFLTIVLLLAAMPVFSEEAAVDTYTPPDSWPKGWYARIETSMGRIVILLLPGQSPQSVAHFVGFARGTLEWTDPITGEVREEPYYEGSEVYVAKGGTLFQVGDKSAAGSYAPFVYVPEKGRQLVNFNVAWRVGNVRIGARVSGSRFLITAGAMPGLNHTVPCFGTVMAGTDIVFNITAVKTYKNGRPIDPVVIRKIVIFSKDDPDPLPEPVPYFPEPKEIQINSNEDLKKQRTEND
jgi:peptidyl-prolyl cis-trans isomerase A (cyclophilin A)